MSIVLVYAVFETADEAKTVARTVVAERLAACANIMPPCHSIYEWDGAVQETSEAPAIFKTDAAHRDALIDRIIDLHSYEVPAVVALEGDASASFAAWISMKVS